jgi:hypothetical protein
MAAHQKQGRNKKRRNTGAARRRLVSHTTTVEKPVAVAVETSRPVIDEISEQTVLRTEPDVEVRKPATLAQALTERAEIVVKPKTRIVRKQMKRRRVA